MEKKTFFVDGSENIAKYTFSVLENINGKLWRCIQFFFSFFFYLGSNLRKTTYDTISNFSFHFIWSWLEQAIYPKYINISVFSMRPYLVELSGINEDSEQLGIIFSNLFAIVYQNWMEMLKLINFFYGYVNSRTTRKYRIQLSIQLRILQNIAKENTILYLCDLK